MAIAAGGELDKAPSMNTKTTTMNSHDKDEWDFMEWMYQKVQLIHAQVSNPAMTGGSDRSPGRFSNMSYSYSSKSPGRYDNFGESSPGRHTQYLKGMGVNGTGDILMAFPTRVPLPTIITNSLPKTITKVKKSGKMSNH